MKRAVPTRRFPSNWLVFCIGVAALPLAGCASAYGEGGRGNEELPDDLPLFDASVDDSGAAEPEAVCAEHAPFHFNNHFSPYLGGEESVDAAVVHFSSFYCIHCANFAAQTGHLWTERPDFASRARIYFHHADYAFRHRAAVAAGNQGMENFWAVHDFIYSHMMRSINPTDQEILDFIKGSLSLDMARFNRELEADETYAFLVWEIEQAQAAGVDGTPTVFVCGRRLPNRNYLETELDRYL
jgi:hypothetical protein